MKMNTFIPLSLAALLLVSCSKYERRPCIKAKGTETSEERTLGLFTHLDIATSTNVYLTQDTTVTATTVRIVGFPNLIENLVTDLEGNRLKIRNKRCIRKGDVTVYITTAYPEGLHISGSGRLIAENTLQSNTLDVSISGSGDMDLEVESKTIEMSISGSGEIWMTGVADRQDISISGSGNVRSFGVTTSQTNISISGSGLAESTVNEELDVSISGSGDVYYKGQPRISVNIPGSGELINAN